MANWALVFLDTRSEGTVTKTPSRPAHTQVLSFCVFSSVTSLSFDLSRGWGGTISQPLGRPELWLPCLPSHHAAHQDSSSLFLPSLPRRPGVPYSLLSNPGPSTLSHRVTHIHIDTSTRTHTHTHTHTLINTHSHSHINTHTCSRLTHICTFTHSHTLLHTITRNHTASLVAQVVKNPPTMRETWVQSLGWEDPLEESTTTHSSILAWRMSMGRWAWRATVHGVTKNRTRLSN